MMELHNGANYDPLQDAVERSAVQEVDLPGFGDGRPWRVKLRRLSLLGMARAGRIPNPLMGAVAELYQTGTMKTAALDKAAEVMLFIAGEALAEPTLKQLEDSGAMLTDEQLLAIYLYAQRGVAALKPFRQEPAVSRAVQDGAAVRPAAKQPARTV